MTGNVFNDPTVYFLQFNGDYSSGDSFYTVSIRGAEQTEFAVVSNSMVAWQYTSPAAGDGIIRLRFTGNGVSSAYAVDDISLIPEPSTYAMIIGLALLGASARRRFRR